MTQYYFSKTTGTFYVDTIHGENMPDDKIAVTEERFLELMAGKGSTKVIVGDDAGNPQLVDFVPSSQVLWADYKMQAQAALDKSDVTVLRCLAVTVAVPTAWNSYRASLRAIISASSGDPTQPLPTRPAYPANT